MDVRQLGSGVLEAQPLFSLTRTHPVYTDWFIRKLNGTEDAIEDDAPFTAKQRGELLDFLIAAKKTAQILALSDADRVSVAVKAETAAALDSMNGLLRGIRLVPTIDVDISRNTLRYRPELFSQNKAENHSTLVYQATALSICELLGNGELELLRRCECSAWFIATRADQLSCTPKCRERRNASTPEFNKKRRDAYRRKKEKEARDAKRKGKGASNAKAGK